MKQALDQSTAKSGHGKRAARRWLLLPALVVFVGSMWWLRARLAQQDATRQAHGRVQAAASASAPAVPAPPPQAQRTPAPAASAPPAAVHTRAEAGLAVHDEEETVEPHPIDAERKALMPPWGTVDGVFEAIEKHDLESARTLLERRQADDPKREEFAGYYVGLEVMLDCLQKPGEESRTRAQGFINNPDYRASPMRRHVRRNCMGK